MTDKVIKRGYVKWTDDDGVFHKEPLSDHAELLQGSSPKDQLYAEEARRLNAAAEKQTEETEKENQDTTKDTVDALKAAPHDVLTAAQLETTDGEVAPAAAAEEPAVKTEPKTEADENHDRALVELREQTAG